MTRAADLRHLLAEPGIVVMPGNHEALSRSAESADEIVATTQRLATLGDVTELARLVALDSGANT